MSNGFYSERVYYAIYSANGKRGKLGSSAKDFKPTIVWLTDECSTTELLAEQWLSSILNMQIKLKIKIRITFNCAFKIY